MNLESYIPSPNEFNKMMQLVGLTGDDLTSELAIKIAGLCLDAKRNQLLDYWGHWINQAQLAANREK